MPLEKLFFNHGKGSSGAIQVKDLSPLRGLPLREIFLQGVPLNDLSPIADCALKGSLKLNGVGLRGLPQQVKWEIEDLELHNNPELEDISGLKGVPLTRLTLYGTSVKDLRALKGAPMKYLHLSDSDGRNGAPVTSLEGLEGMPLQSLYAGEVPERDLSPLKGLPLVTLYINRTNVTDLTPLGGNPHLSNLRAGYTGITDLSPLKGMALRNLGVMEVEVTSLAPLSGMPLEKLNFGGSKVESLKDLDLGDITTIGMEGVPVQDASALEKSPLSNELSFADSKITDFSFLRGNKPKRITLDEAQISAFMEVADKIKSRPFIVLGRKSWTWSDFLRRYSKR